VQSLQKGDDIKGIEAGGQAGYNMEERWKKSRRGVYSTGCLERNVTLWDITWGSPGNKEG